MSLGVALFTTLGGHVTLSSMVGTRIYPDVAPIGVNAPYVVWSEVGNTPMNNLSGAQPDCNNYRVQIVVLAATALRAREVMEQVRAAMAAASLFKSLEVDYGSADFEEGSKIYGVRADFSIWYRTS